jgi:hypothetical protein
MVGVMKKKKIAKYVPSAEARRMQNDDHGWWRCND